MTDDTIRARADDLARAAYGKLVAILASRSGDIAAAEDALSAAFEAALRTWPERGVPDNPEAWLLGAAKNKRIDMTRKDVRLVITDEVPEITEVAFPVEADHMLDERLKLMFVCGHPAIDVTVRTPLMLQAVLGLQAGEIAKAFLLSPTNMAQRLVRAKRKIKAAGIPFALPDQSAYTDRMEAVLEAVYGAYAVDWLEGAGDLSHEAFFLSDILAELAPDNAEALGLNALIGLVEARRDARIRENVLVPVPEQDTALWDRTMIERSTRVLARASALGQIGRFQLEAAIHSVHAARAITGRTDWRALTQLYAGLLRLHPTIGAAVAQAAAVAQGVGPSEGLAMLDKIDFADRERFQPFQAVRAHCLAELGRTACAAEAYAKAISLCTDLPSRRWLEAKCKGLKKKSM